MRFLTKCALLLIPAFALATPALAQTRDLRLADSDEPGSVLVFPKFINAPAVNVDGALLPRTEIEIGVVNPPNTGVVLGEHTTIKVRLHWVCPGTQDVATKFVCRETDFDVFLSINGKLAFSADGTALNANSPRVPAPPCANGYLIAWVVDNADRPIKWDGLIGDAVLRGPALSSGPDAGFSTAVEAYSAIPIQADPALANGALIGGGNVAGELQFDGSAGNYLGVTGKLYGDVKFDNETPRAAGSTPTPGNALSQTWLIMLTLDVDSGFPNLPVFANLDFYNESLNTVSTTNPNFEFPLSTHTHFVCWTQQKLSDIDANLTQAFEQTRKGIVIAHDAQKVPVFGIQNDEPGLVTLLGLVQVFEGTVANGYGERSYIFNMFNDSVFVPTDFEFNVNGLD